MHVCMESMVRCLRSAVYMVCTVCSLHGLHGPQSAVCSLHGLQSAVCSLHGMRFGVTGFDKTLIGKNHRSHL